MLAFRAFTRSVTLVDEGDVLDGVGPHILLGGTGHGAHGLAKRGRVAVRIGNARTCQGHTLGRIAAFVRRINSLTVWLSLIPIGIPSTCSWTSS